MSRSRRTTQVFTMSFLDCICCGFGAVVLIYTIMSAEAGVTEIRRHDDMQGEVNKLEDPVSLDFFTAFQASTIHRPVRRAFFDNVVNETAKVPARVWKSAFRSLYDSPPARVPASCPVSILWGDRDGLFSLWDQETLRRHIPNATFQALKDVGHAPHWEAPDLVIRDMVGILV